VIDQNESRAGCRGFEGAEVWRGLPLLWSLFLLEGSNRGAEGSDDCYGENTDAIVVTFGNF
jgi:hypothetical protein